LKKILFFTIFLFLSLGAFVNFYNNFFFKSIYTNTPSNCIEEFNPNLYKIYNVKTLISYVDSLYGSAVIQPKDSLHYANFMAKTVRNRFYHGLCLYTWKDNWVLYLLNPIHPHSLAIVKPNDILKHPDALCSQQAIVAMIALRNKGFSYRKIGFYDKDRKIGHFTYEIKLKDGWHFFDVDLEPDFNLLVKNNRPSIEALSHNDKLREKAYKKFDTNIRVDLIKSYKNDYIENEYPAKHMLLFHEITRMMSYGLWFILLLVYLFFNKYLSKD